MPTVNTPSDGGDGSTDSGGGGGGGEAVVPREGDNDNAPVGIGTNSNESTYITRKKDGMVGPGKYNVSYLQRGYVGVG